MNDPLEGMKRLGQMILDAELARLKAIQDKMNTQKGRTAALDQQLQARSDQVNLGHDDLALTTGHDATWQTWLRTQRAASNAELAGIAAEREDQLLQARHSFGRAQAIEALQKRALSERALKISKRKAFD